MNKKVSKFIGDLKPVKLKNNKQAVVFIVCILIATILWFLNSMEKDYNTNIFYPVKYVNPPDKLFLSNNPPAKLELNVQMHGFTLLRHKLSFSVSPVVLDLKTISRNAEKHNNTYIVPSETLINKISSQLSSEISIISISPQIIEFQFDSLKSKKVQVKDNVKLSCKPQYFISGNIILKPDSVLITGPFSIIDTINLVYTEPKIYEGISNSIEKTISVNQSENIKISPEKVSVYIPVEKFTEKELSLPIQAENLTEGINLKLFPNSVKATIMVSLSEYEKVNSQDFSATIDYNQAVEGKNRLQVMVNTEKKYLQILKISPDFIEYLIETE